MKKIFKITTVLLLAIMLIGMVGIVPAQAKETNTEWYEQVLDSRSGTFKVTQNGKTKKYKRSDYNYYKVVDINQDGTQELVLSQGEDSWMTENKVLLLTYYKGKIRALGAFGPFKSGGVIAKSGKYLVTYDRNSAESKTVLYKISKGRLKKVIKLYHYHDASSRIHYYANNKSISMNKYSTLLDKYGINDSEDFYYNYIFW